MEGPQDESLGSNGAEHPSNPENNRYDPKYAKLYQAVRTGDLEATRAILEGDPGAVRARISTGGAPPLQMAALFGHLEIVRELLQRMSEEDVALQDYSQLTALHEAIYGEIEIARRIIEKNSQLLAITENHNLLPVTRAFAFGQMKMVRYLYPLTPWEELPETHGAAFLNLCCSSKMFDIALDLLRQRPSLAVTSGFLEAMARIPSAFPSGCQLSFWRKWIYDRIDIPKEQLRTFNLGVHETIQPNSAKFIGIKNIYQIKLAHMQALELLRIACEELLKLNEEQIQTSGACEAVVQATSKGIPEIFTEVLKVRLDLFWAGDGRCLMFDAVEFRQARVFSLIHGMSWKNAVAYLIDCTPDIANNVLLPKRNTLLHTAGLFGPSTELQLHDVSGAALQMQRELQWFKNDFLKSLPTKLIIGLSTLFISMASMLIAFCTALFVMFRGELWIVIPVSFLAAVPVISFGWLQYPLLHEMIMSTYGPSIFDRNVKPWVTTDFI